MRDYLFDIPVLFVIFNRKDVSIKSFIKIKEAKPLKLYIAGDGYRKNKVGDDIKVYETRQAILDLIDWDCEVKTLFQEDNLGCGSGVYTAINWFFENEECGIILEDDCVVQESFFFYMSELLKKYAQDERIGMVAGFNSIGSIYSEYSYCFSKYKACWGWGTWKRAWQNMDLSLKWRTTSQNDSILTNMGYLGKDVKAWKYKLKKIDAGAVSAWDWQWYFSLASKNQLCIFPAFSLVSNIGFGEDATHTTAYTNNMSARSNITFPLSHPSYILPNKEFDKKIYKKENAFIRRLRVYLPISFNKKMKFFFNKITQK